MTGRIENSVIDVYQRCGLTWATLRGDHLVEGAWLGRFCNLLPFGTAVLDMGCGSGLPIARELIRRSFDVVATLMFTTGKAEGHAIGELEGDPLYHGSLGPEEYRALLETADFGVVDHVVEDATCGHRTVWLARQRR